MIARRAANKEQREERRRRKVEQRKQRRMMQLILVLFVCLTWTWKELRRLNSYSFVLWSDCHIEFSDNKNCSRSRIVRFILWVLSSLRLSERNTKHVICICDGSLLPGHMKRRNRRLEKRPPLSSFDCDGFDGSCEDLFEEFVSGIVLTNLLCNYWAGDIFKGSLKPQQNLVYLSVSMSSTSNFGSVLMTV